jgi:hypothetical protein
MVNKDTINPKIHFKLSINVPFDKYLSKPEVTPTYTPSCPHKWVIMKLAGHQA